MSFIFTFTFAFYPWPGRAASTCAPVELALGPARDQFKNWCGVAVATDLLSFDAGHRLAMASVGTNYYVGRSAAEQALYDLILQIPSGEFGGSSLRSALALNLRRPVCLESAWPDSVLLARSESDVNLEIARRRAGLDRTDPCPGASFDFGPLAVKPRGFDAWPSANFKTVHWRLDLGRPVALVVDMTPLFDLGPASDIWAIRTFGDHYVLVIGRREVAGRCQLLIRNSWGADCTRYGPKRRNACRAGHLWIDEADVRSATKSILYSGASRRH